MKKFFIKLAYKFSRKPFLGKMAVFVSLVFVGSLIWTRTVGATGSLSAEGLAQGIMQFGIWAFLSLGELCVKLSVFCLYLFIKLAEYNNYIDLSVVQLGWTMVRDVANMFFVVVLLIIAIGTILGLEQYQWNKTLVKMILAAVFINFSNMICGLFIDVAHVFTITFVNAISATAGGNLISMFKLDRLYDMVYKQPLGEDAKFDVRLFAGACVSFLFAVLTLVTIAAYLVVMLTRVVMLWVLIILSPIAYIAQTLPQGQSYAKEWWDEFSKHVLVAPVMVFFLWLAFATAGSGDLVTGNVEQQKMGIVMNQEAGTELIEEAKEPGEVTTVALTEVATWENMANIIIAIALLWAGLERVQKLGVRGGGMVAKGMDMFKNIATVATGVAAGRWMARKGVEGVKKAPGLALKGALGVVKGVSSGVGFTDALKRTGDKIQRWRTTVPYLRALPIIGRYGAIRKEMLNQEAEKSKKLAEENLKKTIGRDWNLSWRDRVGKKLSEATGGTLGFGMSHLKGTRYKLEEEEYIIGKEKGKSKDLRISKVEKAYAEKSNKAVRDINQSFEEERKNKVEVFINSNAENVAKFGAVDKSFIDSATNDKIEKSVEQSIKNEKAATLQRLFDETEGKTLAGSLITAQSEEKHASEVFADHVRNNFLSLVEEADEDLKDGLSRLYAGLSKEDKVKVDKQRISWHGGNEDYEEGVEKEKQTGEAIRQMLKDGTIVPQVGTELEKGLQDIYKKRNGEELEVKDLELKQAASTDAKTAYKAGLGNFSAIPANIRRAEEEVAARGTVQDRVKREGQEIIKKENDERLKKAEAAFYETDDGKKLAGDNRQAIIDAANAIAAGGSVIRYGEEVDALEAFFGKEEAGKLSFTDKKTLAEKIRSMSHETEHETVKAQVAAEEETGKRLMLDSSYGAQAIALRSAAEQISAAMKGAVDELKSDHLTKEMAKAAKLIEQKINAGGKGVAADIEEALKKNVYVKAAEQQEWLGKKKEVETRKKTQMDEAAKGYFVEKQRYGAITPGTSLVPLSEKVTKDLKAMESQDSASFASKTLRHLLLKTSKNEELEDDQTAFMFGTAQHLGRNGWFDDVISEVVKSIKAMESGKITDVEEIAQIKNLKKVFLDDLHIIDTDSEGGYVSKSSAQTISQLQNLLIASGNTKMIQQHNEGDMLKQRIEKEGAVEYKGISFVKGVNDSYEEILRAVTGSAEAFSKFTGELDKMQEYLQEAASFFKREAINVGHQEYGGHHQYDSSFGGGKFRMAFLGEAQNLMQAEVRKFSNKLKWQYHGLGTADVDKGILRFVDPIAWRNQMQELTSAVKASQVPERTIDAATGSKISSEKIIENGMAVLGTNEDFGGADNYIKDSLLNAILGQGEAIKFLARERWNHVDKIDSDRGVARLKIAGTNVQGERYSDFLLELKRYIKEGALANQVTAEQMRGLDVAISASKQKEASLKSSRGGAERAEVDSDNT